MLNAAAAAGDSRSRPVALPYMRANRAGFSRPKRPDGVTPALTGPEALDFTAVAAIASEVAGREIKRVTVPDDEWKAGFIARGMPAAAVDFTLGIFAASRRGEFAAVDPALGQVLGRQPRTVRDVLAAALPRAA
ncbi:MAG TPA: hypothetical protein VHV09_23455 [Trebonia sp.]|jgi:uncharacterized protein YbjT (DUF2867 family)|nr:hypothetical protein [Trebonia sp.]